MAKITFATGNKNKLMEAEAILGVDLEGTDLKIQEIQSLDPIEVASEKAREYYKQLKRPVVAEDNSLFFDSLNGLPGTLVDYFSDALGNKGIIKLLKSSKNRKAVAQSTLAYVNKSGEIFTFVGKMKGKITMTERGKNGFGWDPIFVPEGSKKTLAEMDLKEKNRYSMRKKAFMKFRNWLRDNS